MPALVVVGGFERVLGLTQRGQGVAHARLSFGGERLAGGQQGQTGGQETEDRAARRGMHMDLQALPRIVAAPAHSDPGPALARRFLVGGLLALVSSGPAMAVAAPAARAQATQVFINGDVWTGEPGQPRAQALALRGGRLLVVGSNAQALARRGPATPVIDLGGRFVAPGFNDAHLHLLVVERAELDGAEDILSLQRRLAAYAQAHPEAAWVRGRGWVDVAFPERVPHRRYLDAVVANRPVYLSDRDGHRALVNSRALELAGVTRATPDPAGGLVARDAAGEPTGELKEAAIELVARLVPPPSAAERYKALIGLLARAASYGLTSAQNASLDPEDLPAFERAEREGRLTLRMQFAPPLEKHPGAAQLARARDLRRRYRGPLIHVRSVKGIVDGTVDARTASMLEPYVGGGIGLPQWTRSELDEAALAYDRAGFQIQLHAIGDRAIRLALDTFEHVQRLNGRRDRRHRVEHIEVPSPEDLPRFKALGVIASTQALFANPDTMTFENYAVLLGPVRAARANAFKAFDDAGAVQAFGSDWPVFSMEVLKGVYCAAARRTVAGTPPGGYYPEQRLSVEAALRHFTLDAAYASHEEREKGSLVAGKLADFVVLSQDPSVPPLERVLDTRVLLTVMGGRETWRSPEWPRAAGAAAR